MWNNQRLDGMEDNEPFKQDIILPSVRIAVPSTPQTSIPSEPYKPKYQFGSVKEKKLTTINENKETIEKLTIEEKLQSSSIMAMQLEGLNGGVGKEKIDGHNFFTFESENAFS